MKHLFFLILFILMSLHIGEAIAQTHRLTSPDGKLLMEIKKSPQGYVYSFTAHKKLLIKESALGFRIETGNTIPSQDWTLEKVSRQTIKNTWTPVWGKRSIVPDHYHEMALELKDLSSSTTRQLRIIARAYNDGITFKYEALTATDGTRLPVMTIYQSAWRVILYGNQPGTLVDSHLIELLNPDSSPEYDFSWVKPGIAVWDWRINGAIYDGFNYLVLDADWYQIYKSLKILRNVFI